MPHPIISVLMPAYNGERFLAEAIDSVLNQTFTDFELLIIDDGSNDDTENIIKRYSDTRIVYIGNDKNYGLIYSLNKGIDLAKGKYIVRMDADDICLPERFQKQFEWLENNSATSVVGCYVSFINDNDKVIGDWKADLQTATSLSIKNKMIWENCIAHPSIMIKADLLKEYRYRIYQKNIEDYDLWLRMLADGKIIEKVPEKLLFYRVHETSVTGSILRKTNPFFKQYNCKRKFLLQQTKAGKWGLFENQVLMTMLHNGLMGIGKNIKGNLKS